ncbi:glycoside hydrolase family 130 protein [Labrenzia sp. 011]|uniref:glycoside hydrolase family 130 protein n=1 Tax=Labrenzia sp. 011 TaxID=2171494 RepID=UPI000D513444|nr:glycoside hydrolase family 130 protein [Labrenzia sp. 011]PVB62772.1 glycosidase [Labrenzia sp. 011]
MSLVNTLPLQLHANANRVVVRHFQSAPGPRALSPASEARARRIVATVREMDNRTIQAELALVLADFESRHREVRRFFEDRYEGIARDLDLAEPLRDVERALIGAYFCHEYSFEAAALMNPSVVPHPDQTGLADGELRFLLSLRAVGEGHISSITFREGVFTAQGDMRLDPQSRFAVAAVPRNCDDGRVDLIREGDKCLSELVLFPVTAAQRNGLEDLRLVQFREDDGDMTYYGTYTAYSGDTIASEMLITRDFSRFELRPLSGPAARNKGMALFPRRVDGAYVMVARQDNENLFLLRSNDLFHWEEGAKLAAPLFPWELVQIGNCGSPIEVDEGWLVLTHGVGPMRKYAIGAMLLDKEDPSRVLGRSRVPLLSPSDEEREGYVPNVVYTCGGLVHAGRLLLPYGIADSSVAFATVDLNDLLATLG